SSVTGQRAGESLCEDQGELQRLLDFMSENEVLPAGGRSTVTDESKSRGGHHGDTNSLKSFPTGVALGKADTPLETQQLGIQSQPSQPEKAAAPESSLTSCTVVEGLLFPVEYYVRTTRRMSSCQRKVDLDAVILSQLGKSKKGQRSKCKQKDANSSQERAENDLESGVVLLPFLGAENDPANSSSPQKSLPASSGSSTALESVSPTSTASTKRDRRRSQGRQKGRRKSACKRPGHQLPQELGQSSSLPTPREGSSLLTNECQSEKENCEANLEKWPSDDRHLPGESSGGHSRLVAPESPASLGLPAVDSGTCGSLFSFRSLQWLGPTLGVREFHLPDEEFGQLKLEKFESSPVNDLEVFVPSVFGGDVASGDMQDAQMSPEEKTLKSSLPSPFRNGLPKLPPGEGPASKRDLSTPELLFTPLGTALAGAPTQPESQVSSSVFPVVGATPAVSPAVRAELFPSSPSAPPSRASPPASTGASARALGDGESKDSAVPLHLDSPGAGPARRGEERGATVPLEAEGGPDNKSAEAVALEKPHQSESQQQRSSRAPSEQKKDAAEQLAPGLLDGLPEESLQLVSKLKDSSGSCAVDASTVWWEAAGSRELCVVTAGESSVSLWKPLASDRWGKVHTWQLGEVPVIQIVPLPDTCNLVCIALGDLEIGEIRLLLYSSENDSFNQSLVKTGTIKAVLGLKDRRLVSSSRTVQEQHVEIVSLSETGGSKDGQTLMPPEETVLAFAEVEGMREALVGTTAANGIVVWNLKTGQLLKKMHVGYSYPASICHRAYSDTGLLFVVLSHPHAKESESCGNPAFRVVAFNPKTARSMGVMFSSLPPAHAGR
ncbi:PALB2 protein, partial [Halcyon senegalensis]|nr:PALB2 protein [Halcyon senegalensis]